MTAETAAYARLLAIGRGLFGKPTRMTLGMFCSQHQGETVTTPQYTAECRLRDWPTSISTSIDMPRFVQVGMVARLPRDPNRYSLDWLVKPGGRWRPFEALVEEDAALRRDHVERSMAKTAGRLLEFERALRATQLPLIDAVPEEVIVPGGYL